MLLHRKRNVKTAGRAPVLARITLAAESNLRAAVNAGGYVDRDLASGPFFTLPAAIGTWPAYDLALAVALVAGNNIDELAKDTALRPA